MEYNEAIDIIKQECPICDAKESADEAMNVAIDSGIDGLIELTQNILDDIKPWRKKPSNEIKNALKRFLKRHG